MNFLIKGICIMVTLGFLVSCGDDDIDANPTGVGVTEITFVSIGTDVEDGDGTLITVTTQGIGATSYVIDFGDPNSEEDIFTKGVGSSVSYDYPNEDEEVTYTITVTAKADGLADVVRTQDITVVHVPEGSISTVPGAPTGTISNVFAMYSDGLEYDGGLLEYRWGEAVSGGVGTLVGEENILRLSRLGSDAGVLSFGEAIDPASAFGDGIAATHIHFDVNSIFSEGIDLLKITLVNSSASATYVVDGLALIDDDWASFDFALATGFSGAVSAIDEIHFELGTGGTANEHASIYVDNIYLYKETGSSILNGDFAIEGTYATSQWRFTTFTDGEATPFGSSSDGSDFDIDGNDTGGKTRGAKWSSSQSAGQLASSSSRYAYQALNLTPNTDYVLEYQYAIDDDNDEIIGGRHLVGLVLNGHYLDGADAVSDVTDNLGSYAGYYAEGKFSDTPNDYGTFAQVPFTSNESGEVAVMFYSVAPDDAWIDNVKVVEAASSTAPSASYTFEVNSSNFLEYSFTNISTSGASFTWDFGDGSTSTEKSPTHTYASEGTYNLVLTATNSAGSSMANETISVIDPAVVLGTFEAVLLNGTLDEYDTDIPNVGNNKDDNNDAWETDPPNELKDGSASPYTWDNSGLRDDLGLKAAGITTSSNNGNYALKFSSAERRAYQPFDVEEGVEYTITMWVRTETTNDFDVYILSSEVQNENDLAGNSYTQYTVSGNPNSYVEHTFTFIPTTSGTSTAVFYAVPHAEIDGDSEAYLDDISIATPGF